MLQAMAWSWAALLAARSPAHPFGGVAAEVAPAAESAAVVAAGVRVSLTFLLWCLENQGVYTLEAKGPGSSLLYDVGQFSVMESFGKSTLSNCLV